MALLFVAERFKVDVSLATAPWFIDYVILRRYKSRNVGGRVELFRDVEPKVLGHVAVR